MRNLLVLAAVLAASSSVANAEPTTTTPPKREVAIIAGGCFWGMEHVMLGMPGIISMDVGYAGGKSTSVGYKEVSAGSTGHAEAVRIVFDPSKVSYDAILLRFFRGHDPTQVDRQSNDIGTQYRSEIFTTTPTQFATALAIRSRVDHSHAWKKPIVTKIEPATTWVRAEDYHQDYLVKHPTGYNDHFLRPFTF
jgi:peptide methionine sulfoxide reductase msrA/msrB